jgi:3-methyladenine DNA glycosylase AlkD
MSEFDKIRSALRSAADPAKAEILARFFKTGPGEYGEGDRFIGVVVPKIRKIAKVHAQAARGEIRKLLRSPYHEERLAALLILVEQYRRGDASQRRSIYELYLANASRINNWDLVDLSAQHIVGAQLYTNNSFVLTKLARSKNLWERRIAMLSTYYFIRRGESGEALRIAELLLHDPHDLIHKAAGWMLREVGKRCSQEVECRFLDRYAGVMPRTMLRYAIEHFPDELRTKYMQSAVRTNRDRSRDRYRGRQPE